MKKRNIIIKLFIFTCFILTFSNKNIVFGKSDSIYIEKGITLSIGQKYEIYPLIKPGKGEFDAQGKYTISDTSILGVESKYDKENKYWEDSIIGLRPGKATVTEWCNNKKRIQYQITVTRRKLDSISSFQGDNIYKSEKTDKAVKEILKSLDLGKYSSDRERIAVLSRYLSKKVSYGNNEYDQTPYGTLVLGESVCGGHAKAMRLLFQNLGYDVKYLASKTYNHAWNLLKLEGIYYLYDLVIMDERDSQLYGSECYGMKYAGEGTYTDESGKVLPGSLYSDVNGDISDSLITSYRNDIWNDLLCTRGFAASKETEEEDSLYYLSDRKSHLPAWLIGSDTDQQNILKGESKALPNDRLSAKVFSSDESVVKVVDDKIVGINNGIAIIYRYDDTYCDAFYVFVDSKVSGKKKTIQFKANGKKHQSYTTSDMCSNRKVLEQSSKIEELMDIDISEDLWRKTITYNLEPALNGGKLVTSYNNGYLKTYTLNSNGNKQILLDDKEDEY